MNAENLTNARTALHADDDRALITFCPKDLGYDSCMLEEQEILERLLQSITR